MPTVACCRDSRRNDVSSHPGCGCFNVFAVRTASSTFHSSRPKPSISALKLRCIVIG
jgi:hypothetical protein